MLLIDKIAVKFLQILYRHLRRVKKREFNRVLPLAEYIVDRWEKAAFLGFGKGSSIYDSALVIGSVNVGENTWIGPNVMLDGSGGLTIGSHCSISMGCQIYTHDSVEWAQSGGEQKYKHAPVSLGDHCYLGPNVVVQKGVTIGNRCVVGANSLVNCDLPDGSRAFGNPAKVVT